MTVLHAGLLTGTLTLIACLAPVVTQTERVPVGSLWTAPAREAAKSNPLAHQPNAVAGGHKLFLQRCSTCHGDDGRGTNRGPDLAAADVQAQPDGALFWKISSGNTHGGMPSFSFLPAPQRWQLVLHLRQLVVLHVEP